MAEVFTTEAQRPQRSEGTGFPELGSEPLFVRILCVLRVSVVEFLLKG